MDLGEKVEGGGYSVTSDLDLGKKVGKLNSGGGVFCNFGFGLRKKSWEIEFRREGGVFCNFGFGLRKKSWEIEFRRGVFCNFGFGLREKS